MRSLPAGWNKTTVGEVCEKIRGVSYDKNEAFRQPNQGLVPILRANNIVDDHITLADLVYVPKTRVTAKQELIANDVIVAMSSGSKRVVGKTAQLSENWNGSFGAFCGVLRPLPGIDGRFFGYFFWTAEYRLKISELASGTNINNLKNEHFAQLDFPVPPVNEQRRIVAKLDKLLSRVGPAQERLSTIPHILKRFRQSVLAAACSGQLTTDWRNQNPDTKAVDVPSTAIEHNSEEGLPNSWAMVRVGDVIEELKYGTSRKSSYEKFGVPVLRIPNIGDGVIDPNDMKYAPLPPKEFHQLKLSAGDILLIRSNGSVSLVGKSALVRETETDFAYAGYLIRLKPNRAHIEPRYLNLVLSSQRVRVQIEIPARSTSGVNNINGNEVKALEIALAPLAEQQEIVRSVEALFNTADVLEARYFKAKAHVDKLTQSILAKAFRGELVPQDPHDEPASVLLERVRQQRNGSSVTKVRSNTKRSGR